MAPKPTANRRRLVEAIHGLLRADTRSAVGAMLAEIANRTPGGEILESTAALLEDSGDVTDDDGTSSSHFDSDSYGAWLEGCVRAEAVASTFCARMRRVGGRVGCIPSSGDILGRVVARSMADVWSDLFTSDWALVTDSKGRVKKNSKKKSPPGLMVVTPMADVLKGESSYEEIAQTLRCVGNATPHHAPIGFVKDIHMCIAHPVFHSPSIPSKKICDVPAHSLLPLPTILEAATPIDGRITTSRPRPANGCVACRFNNLLVSIPTAKSVCTLPDDDLTLCCSGNLRELLPAVGTAPWGNRVRLAELGHSIEESPTKQLCAGCIRMAGHHLMSQGAMSCILGPNKSRCRTPAYCTVQAGDDVDDCLHLFEWGDDGAILSDMMDNGNYRTLCEAIIKSRNASVEFASAEIHKMRRWYAHRVLLEIPPPLRHLAASPEFIFISRLGNGLNGRRCPTERQQPAPTNTISALWPLRLTSDPNVADTFTPAIRLSGVRANVTSDELWTALVVPFTSWTNYRLERCPTCAVAQGGLKKAMTVYCSCGPSRSTTIHVAPSSARRQKRSVNVASISPLSHSRLAPPVTAPTLSTYSNCWFSRPVAGPIELSVLGTEEGDPPDCQIFSLSGHSLVGPDFTVCGGNTASPGKPRRQRGRTMVNRRKVKRRPAPSGDVPKDSQRNFPLPADRQCPHEFLHCCSKFQSNAKRQNVPSPTIEVFVLCESEEVGCVVFDCCRAALALLGDSAPPTISSGNALFSPGPPRFHMPEPFALESGAAECAAKRPAINNIANIFGGKGWNCPPNVDIGEWHAWDFFREFSAVHAGLRILNSIQVSQNVASPELRSHSSEWH